MQATIRTGRQSDLQALLALVPGLADFPLPANRQPEHLWAADAALLRQHFAGETAHSRVLVAAANVGDAVFGFALFTLGKEMLSGEPSAHLEAIVVAAAGRGQGLGRALLAQVERLAVQEGARSLTLHALSTNQRARGLYESVGFDAELIRYSKPLAHEPTREE